MFASSRLQQVACGLLVLSLGEGLPSAGEATSFFGPAWDDGRAEVAAYEASETIYGEPRKGEEFLITVTEEQDRRALVKATAATPSEARRAIVKLNRERTIPTGIYTYRQFSSAFLDRDTLELTKIAMSSQEWCGTSFVEATVRQGLMSLRTFSYFEGQGDRDFELAWPEGSWAEDALPLLVRSLPVREAGRRELKLLPSLLSNRVAEPRLVEAVLSWSAATMGRQEVRVAGHVLVLEASEQRRLLSWVQPDGDRAEFRRSDRLPYWKLNGPGDEALRSALSERPERAGN